jgi:redox-sensitive bicupin YhaK (pirin superfamily)
MNCAKASVTRGVDRFRTSTGGVSTWHCFSFGDHYDPANLGLGPLLAVNDVTLETGAGFSTHRHRDTEIVTWVVSGALLHQDSQGGRHLTGPGVVQRLSAGAGIEHSETAPLPSPRDAGEPGHGGSGATRFVQMWVQPDRDGGPAAYDTGAVDAEALSSRFAVLASAADVASVPPAVTIRREGAVLVAARMTPGDLRTLPGGALAHLFVVTGTVRLSGSELFLDDAPLEAGDSASLTDVASVDLRCLGTAEVLLWGIGPQG